MISGCNVKRLNVGISYVLLILKEFKGNFSEDLRKIGKLL